MKKDEGKSDKEKSDRGKSDKGKSDKGEKSDKGKSDKGKSDKGEKSDKGKSDKGKSDKGKKKKKEVRTEGAHVESKPATDGKWGWFVVFNSFICNMIVDGLQYTFANFLDPISISFNSSTAEVAFIGSLLPGFYNFSGPIAGALANKFGFRMVVITGSITSAGGLMLSYFAPNTAYLYFFYGVLGGLGFGMIYMASVITTSLYFDKYRALAASLSVCGTGVGTFVFSPLGNFLVDRYGWKLALVFEGVIVLACILSGLSFKPVEIISVVPVSRKPSEASVGTHRRGSIYYPLEQRRTLPNDAYPTYKEALLLQVERGSTLTSLTPKNAQTASSESFLNSNIIYSVTEPVEDKRRESKPKRCAKCAKCCRVCCFKFWHCRCQQKDFTLGDRPMYRDDIFYGASLNELGHSHHGSIDYHLSVTRIPGPQELNEHAEQKCCVCHTAVLRTCVTMTGFHLLKSKIFTFLCISSFFYTMGLFIPYVFIQKLAINDHIPEQEGIWLVSAIGISNTGGRMASGLLKSFCKNVNASFLALVSLALSGLISTIFIFSRSLACFAIYSCVFGFFTAPFISLRPIIIVDFLGLERLTNAFGLVLLGQGVASIIGPPIAGLIHERTHKCEYTIYLAGGLMMFSSFMLLLSVILSMRQKKKEEEEEEEEDEEEKYAIIPPNGGWGWLVVASAFYCNVVVDGIMLTFGVFLKSISETFKAGYSEVALAGSLMFGIHLLMGPVCAGCSDAFGLRPVTIVGSLICSFGVGIAYFSTGCWHLYITYGLLGGMGLGLVYMNSLVITSLYFTTLMPIAIAIVVSGTGVGTMVFAALGQFLLTATTWRNSFLMQAALAGSMSLAAITFRPLKPKKVMLFESPSPLATIKKSLPSAGQAENERRTSIFIKREMPDKESFASLGSMIWNDILEQKVVDDMERPREFKCACSKCCRKFRKDSSDDTVLVLSEIKALQSQDRRKSYVEKQQDDEEALSQKQGPSHRSRRNSVSHHTVFKRIDVEKRPKQRVSDTLKKAIIATSDCHLLKSFAFCMFTISGALQMASLLIVYIYEKDRCTFFGFSEETSVYFVITLGGSNMLWRLILGGLATLPKINYRALSICGTVIGGTATMLSGLSKNVYYQFGFCVFFGLGMASFAVFRFVLLIDLVETKFISNATGINLLFMGVFCIVSPPLFGWAMECINNYDVIFCTTGVLIIMSGLMLINLHKLRRRELMRNVVE